MNSDIHLKQLPSHKSVLHQNTVQRKVSVTRFKFVFRFMIDS